jgi:hypothetical protein
MAETRNRFIGVKLSPVEYRELRLLAAVERVNQSEAIRRAVKSRIEALVGEESDGAVAVGELVGA